MVIKVLINGVKGKMGQATRQALSTQSDFLIVGETGRENNLLDEITKNKPDVVVDFTNIDSAYQNLSTIIEANVHPVIGTTGFTPSQIEELQKRCQELNLGGLIAPNFSLGAIMMMKASQEIARYFPHVEIIEMHHDGKLDSPSGTAVKTADMIATVKSEVARKENLRETVKGALGADYQNIRIHSVRLPGLVAHQQVIFGGKGETITIRHDSLDRQCFMPGVILACKKVLELKELVVGLEHLL